MLALAGRLLIAALFIVSGIWHVTHFEITAAYFARIGLPYQNVVAGLNVVVEIGAGLLLFVGWRLRGVAWFLAAFVLVATALGHRFWEADPARYFGELSNFLKNLAIIGGLLVLASRGKA
jgi:putative oxidoreductase